MATDNAYPEPPTSGPFHTKGIGDLASLDTEGAETRQSALRYNQNKPQLSFILSAPAAMDELARVLEFGAQKYERDNWKKGMTKEVVADSALRHLSAMLNGEVLDPESGLRHSAHFLCNAMFLAEFDTRGDYDGEEN